MYYVLEYGAVRILPLAFASRPRPLSPPSALLLLSISHFPTATIFSDIIILNLKE